MEDLCYYHLKDNIDIKFKSSLEEQNRIEEYFDSEHNDKIITKNEIASAVRRYITRFLLNGNKKENIVDPPDLELYKCLERQYLWNNKIFSEIKDNFNELLKNYIGKPSFSLKVRHAFEFYNIIGKDDENLLKNERKKFFRIEPEVKENLNIVVTDPPRNAPKVSQIIGMKKIELKDLDDSDDFDV